MTDEPWFTRRMVRNRFSFTPTGRAGWLLVAGYGAAMMLLCLGLTVCVTLGRDQVWPAWAVAFVVLTISFWVTAWRRSAPIGKEDRR